MVVKAGCIEFAPFRLAPGVTERTLVEASDRLQRDLEKLPGLLGRVLLREGPSEWVDIVFWRRKEDTAAMAEVVRTSTAVKSYFDCMSDPEAPEFAVRHFDCVKVYGLAAGS